MKFAIIGCGLIGQKRSAALAAEHAIAVCVDVSRERAEALASRYPGARAETDAAQAVRDPDVDAVVVATTHDALASTTLDAVRSGKHVLVEKPAARSAEELRPIVEEAGRRDLVAKVGFNHRFHPAFQRAHAIFQEGGIGPLRYIRARYGHGGRPGYEREWRADPVISGGGELLDQGSHLIDLSRWFAGNFTEATGHLDNYFWPMPVEDNAFMLLKTAGGEVAWLHASWTEWKNLFSFEIFGQTGKLQIDGLGGSYGTERLTYYRMLPEMGPPETTSWEFPGGDQSWRDETRHFVDCIEQGVAPLGTVEDAWEMLKIVGRLYEGGASRAHHA